MVSSVTVHIDRSEKSIFTNHDKLSGTVRLEVGSLLALSLVEVKLEGVADSEIQLKNEKNRVKTVHDMHRVLYDTAVVFPPENIRQVLQQNERTLTPGTYTFPFQFTIPARNACQQHAGGKSTFSHLHVVNVGPSQWRGRLHESWGNQELYHLSLPLPPLLSVGRWANVKYFVKVTCRRVLFFKMNLRSIDPFVFMPTDLERQSVGEVFFRKSLVFPGEAQRSQRSFFSRMFTSPEPTRGVDVPFSLEMRFPDYPQLAPNRPFAFTLLFISDVNPQTYAASGLGSIFVHTLDVDLIEVTQVLVPEPALQTAHIARTENRVVLSSNHFDNLQFDLANARPKRGAFELEVPSKYFTNGKLPKLTPSFRTCNIERTHMMRVRAVLSAERTLVQKSPKFYEVLLTCPEIEVLSGIQAAPSMPKRPQSPRPPPLLLDSPRRTPKEAEAAEQALPTYEDALLEGTNGAATSN